MENKQHVQLPNKMGIDGLNPKDQLVYVCIRSYANKDTLEAFPSLQTLASRLKISIPTISASIKRLAEKGYISIRKEKKRNIYKFNSNVSYEPFSSEFLDNDKISFEAKAYIAASQQYMFKNIEGYGLTSLSNRELAKKINISEYSVRKYNQELLDKNYLTIVENEARNLETGCKTDTKVFHLSELDQAIIWILKRQGDKINQNAEDISNIYKMLNDQNKVIQNQNKLINALIKERKIENPEFKID